MALELFIAETQSGRVLAQVPGKPTAPLAREASGFASATFAIPLSDPSMPAGWQELLAEQKHAVLVVDACGTERAPVWFGLINQRTVSNGGATLSCVSTEWLLDARRANDRTYANAADLSKIVRDLVADFEAGGIGAGLTTDAPDSGVSRAWSVRRSEGKSPSKCFEELGIEWSVELAWAGSGQGSVRKILRARRFDPTVLPAVSRVIQVPTHTTSWTWTGSRLEAESATAVFVEGDGSGDLKTVSLPVIDEAREAAGYPRVEAWESVAGITNAAEAGQMAQQFAASRFANHERVELTARNTAEGSPLAGLQIGDAVRVVIDTESLQRTADYRLASWELDPSGEAWKPVLVPAEFGLAGWRRPTARKDALDARQEKKLQQATPQDPLKNGYEWEGARIDPKDGFQIKNSDGGWGGIGSGGGSSPSPTSILGKIATDVWGTAPGMIKIEPIGGGEVIEAARSEWLQPTAGREVAVAKHGGDWVALTPVTRKGPSTGGEIQDPGAPTPHPGVVELQLEAGFRLADEAIFGRVSSTRTEMQWIILAGAIVTPPVTTPAGTLVTILPLDHRPPMDILVGDFWIRASGRVELKATRSGNTVLHFTPVQFNARTTGLTSGTTYHHGLDEAGIAFATGHTSGGFTLGQAFSDPRRFSYWLENTGVGQASTGVLGPNGTSSTGSVYTTAHISSAYAPIEENSLTWMQLSLENGYKHGEHIGGGNTSNKYLLPFRVAKTGDGRIYLDGEAWGGTQGARVAVLPEGYRPRHTLILFGGSPYYGLRIEPDGSIYTEARGSMYNGGAQWIPDH